MLYFVQGISDEPTNSQILKEEEILMTLMAPHVNIVKLLAVVEHYEGL